MTDHPGRPPALPLSLLSRRGAVAALAAAAIARPTLLRAQATPRVRLLMDWAFQAPHAFALVAAKQSGLVDREAAQPMPAGQRRTVGITPRGTVAHLDFLHGIDRPLAQGQM